MSIRDSLLALLDAGPRHGYQLKTEFETATGGVWSLNVGQVYSTLERLERDGLATGGEADADGRRVFTITPEGHRAVSAFMGTPGGTEAPAREGLMLKVLVAVAADTVDALEVIRAERSSRMAALQQRRRSAREAGLNGVLAPRLALDGMVTQTEAELRWLDRCEERILAAPAHTPTDDPREPS